MPSVYISYGLSEGSLTGRNLAKALRSSGFSLTRDVRQATHIFAHSGGCFVIPPTANAEHILLVDIPYWPGKHTLRGIAHKLMIDYRYRLERRERYIWWLHLARHGISSLNIAHTLQLWRGQRADTIWSLPVSKLTIIRNQDDTFHAPDIELPFKQPVQTIVLPGQHDDCWDNPEPYVKLLQGAPRG